MRENTHARIEAEPPFIKNSRQVIAAVATAPGEGAIGMLRLSGGGCLKVAAGFLNWGDGDLAPRMATVARAYSAGRLLDKVVVTLFPGPRSYTGEDLIEITAHGSSFILSHLLEEACSKGAKLAEPGEFSRRAFLNGRMDLAQAEAVCALIRAKTRLAHRAAIEQMEGGLSKKIHTLKNDLLELLAVVEAGLDHPDEDIPEFSQAHALERIEKIRVEIERLIESYRVGKLASNGARITIMGMPNVGKSSVLNALLGRERAIVAEVAGTTRDTLEELIDLDGLTAVLTDTAGLREDTRDPVELMGIDRARRAFERADLILVVIDASRDLSGQDRTLINEAYLRNVPVIVAMNKSDLPARVTVREVQQLNHPIDSAEKPIKISALTGAGIVSLAQSMKRALGAGVEGESVVIVTSLHQRQALEQAREALRGALPNVANGELAALGLREALAALGGIVGETTNEDLLKRIFSTFCIGK